MTPDLDKIRNRIRALFAKAEATTHEGEANLFFQKAQELMETYQVELFELRVEDPIGMTRSADYQSGPPAYKSDVQTHLASYYGCTAIKCGTAKHWRLEMVGPESARVTTEIMTDYVWAQVCKQGGELAKQGRYNRQQAIRHVANALCRRVAILVQEKKAVPAKEGTSFSLVVVDLIDDYIEKTFTNIKWTRRAPKELKQSAIEAAKNINLSRQVSTGKNTLRIE